MAKVIQDGSTGATIASVDVDPAFVKAQRSLRDPDAIMAASAEIMEFEQVIEKLETLGNIIDDPDEDVDVPESVSPAAAEGSLSEEISAAADEEDTFSGISWKEDKGEPLLPEEAGGGKDFPAPRFEEMDPEDILRNARASGMVLRDGDDEEDEEMSWGVEVDDIDAGSDDGDDILSEKVGMREALDRARVDDFDEDDFLSGLDEGEIEDGSELDDGEPVSDGSFAWRDDTRKADPRGEAEKGAFEDGGGHPSPVKDPPFLQDQDALASLLEDRDVDLSTDPDLPGDEDRPDPESFTDPDFQEISGEGRGPMVNKDSDETSEETSVMSESDAGKDDETGAAVETRDAEFEEEVQPARGSGGKSKKLLLAASVAALFAFGGVTAFTLLAPSEPQTAGTVTDRVSAIPEVPPALVDVPPSSEPDIDMADVERSSDEFSIDDLRIEDVADGSGIEPPSEGQAGPEDPFDPLDGLARGLEADPLDFDLGDLFLDIDEPDMDFFVPETDRPEEEVEPIETVSAEDFETLANSVSVLSENLDTLFDAIEQRDARILELSEDLDLALAQARRAESLAIAQNEVLVRFVAAEEKLDMAEQLIVDLSRRLASVESIDAADRGVVEARLDRMEERLGGLTSDIGMVARMVLNGSPARVSGSSTGNTVFDRGDDQLRSPVADPANVPSDVEVGDFVNGFGAVLDIFRTTEGGRMVVMENGTVILN